MSSGRQSGPASTRSRRGGDRGDCRQFVVEEGKIFLLDRGGRQRAPVRGARGLLAVAADEDLDGAHARRLVAQVVAEVLQRAPAHAVVRVAVPRLLPAAEPAAAALVRAGVDDVRAPELLADALLVRVQR